MLAGEGLSWQDGRTYAVRAGDCILHMPGAEAHTIAGAGDGLDVLAYGSGSDTGVTWLPRARAWWLEPRWLPAERPGPVRRGGRGRPARAAGAGAGRPATIVALDGRRAERTAPRRRRERATRPRRRARLDADRRRPPRRGARKADLSAALPLGRGGAVRRARGRRDAAARRRRAAVRAGQRRRAPAGDAASRTPSAPATTGLRCSRSAPASRTTSRTTRARARSRCAASACGSASTGSTTGTASRAEPAAIPVRRSAV